MGQSFLAGASKAKVSSGFTFALGSESQGRSRGGAGTQIESVKTWTKISNAFPCLPGELRELLVRDAASFKKSAHTVLLVVVGKALEDDRIAPL
jgi:hypothetical protein